MQNIASYTSQHKRDFLSNQIMNQQKHHGLRILFVYKVFFPDSIGGGEQVLLELCKGFLKRGHEVAVFTASSDIKNSEILLYEGIKVYRYPPNFEICSTPFIFQAMKDFKRIQAEYDIINFHFPYPFGDFMMLVSGLTKPLVVTYHSDIIKQKILRIIYWPLMKLLLKRARAIVSSSENYLESSLYLRPYRYKCSAIPLGLDKTRYPKTDSNTVAALQQQYGGRFFCFIGVFRYYKGLIHLVEAASAVKCTIVIIGDGPQRQKLQSLAKSNKTGKVVFVGKVNDQLKVDILSASYGFVFPSNYRSEAYGLSLVEAAMYGKPMISCEIYTGTSFVNQNGRTGIVVPPSNPAALAEAMNKLLDNPALAKRYGQAALDWYQTALTAEKMCDSYNVVFQKVYQDNRS
jgi:O-antigen biosynthesis rhamnosyltransferase